MERLTEKVNGEYIHKVHKCSLNDCYEKLGKLEDIEDELGISLEVLFKALKEGIYRFYEEFEDEPPYIYYLAVDLCYDDANEKEWCLVGLTNTPYYLKDYGKTWALTREELE